MWFPFQKKLERARRFQREQLGLDPEEGKDKQNDGSDDPGIEIEHPPISEQMEKGDLGALFLSAFLTLFLPSMLILGLIVLLACWIFGVF